MSTRPLPELDAEAFRRRLAGFDKPTDAPSLPPEEIRQHAIRFVAALPLVFGDTLDRTTLWDRIASALETAYAKSVTDRDLFITAVLEHIKAEPTKAVNCEPLQGIMLAEWTQADSEAWMRYLATHRLAVLVHAKSAWEGVKTERKTRRKARESQQTIASFVPPEDDQ